MADTIAMASMKLKEAHHRGWLAGVALRLASKVPGHNPYHTGTEEFLSWEAGFEEGFEG